MSTPLLITDFDLISHGFQVPDEFPGCDSGKFQHCVTSSGVSEKEAFETVLEEIKNMNLGDLDLTKMADEAGDLSDTFYEPPLEYDMDDDGNVESDYGDSEDKVFYYSIRFNLTRKKKK